MPEQVPPTPRRPQLTDMQLTRLDFARRDLESIRSQDFHQMTPAALVLALATLVRRLDDSLGVVTELCGPLQGPSGPVERHP